MTRIRLAATTALFWLATTTPAQEPVPRAEKATTGAPKSLRMAAVEFRSCRDLDRNVAGITAHIRRLGERGSGAPSSPNAP
jgi:hypothetical protein